VFFSSRSAAHRGRGARHLGRIAGKLLPYRYGTFKLSVSGGREEHPVAAGILYVVWLVVFLAAIRAENRKRFREPLRQLSLILEDLKR
jgi:hypothetical protein